MKCGHVYKYICENLDANVDSARCRAIRKHLESCTNCSSYLDSVKKTIQLYQGEPGPRVPLSTHKRLFRVLDTAILASVMPKQRGKRATLSNR